jgi:di/tricarboxylate transporter
VLINQELILIIVTSAAIILLLTNRLRADLVGLMVLLVLAFAGVVTPEQALSGFSSAAVITIIGLFFITQGLEDTGVIQSLANRLRQMGGGQEARLILIFMTSGAVLSLLMNNIAAGAVLLPAAVQVARDSGVRPSKVLIPLSFGTLVGGMATYFTTANIILSSIVRDQGFEGLGMGDFIPTGGLIVIAGLLFMALIGRRWLPTRDSITQQYANPGTLSRALYETYQLEERLWEAKVTPWSPLAHKPLSKSQIGEKLGVTVLAIWRGHQAIFTPDPTETIEPNDYLLILGREDRVTQIKDWGVVLGRDLEGGHHIGAGLQVDLSEVIVPPRSSVIGKTLTDLAFRNKYGLTSVALWREGRSYRTDVGKFPLQVGDALLMVGTPAKIRQLAQERDYLVVQSSHSARPRAPQKGVLALLITVLALALSIFGIVPTAEAMLVGALFMALSGCVNLDDAYRRVEWRVVFLIAGMLPISIAMINTGLAQRISELMVNLIAPFGDLALIAGLFLMTMLVVQILGGQVTALVVGPIAVTAALQIGISVEAVAVAVSIACSTAFLTPIAHPVNILMMAPGGYKPSDFTKVGIGMTVVTLAVLLVGMVVFWNIR